jgi:hypothetical protein
MAGQNTPIDASVHISISAWGGKISKPAMHGFNRLKVIT